MEDDKVNDLDLKEFLRFCREKIGYKGKAKIRLYDDHNVSKEMKSMAAFFPETDEIWVLRGQRVRADWYRSLAHELVHLRQREEGVEMNGADGSDIENEANSLAAVILREYGRNNPSIYEPINNLLTEGWYENMNIATIADAINRGIIDFDPNNYDTFPSYVKLLNWMKDSSKQVFKKIEELDFDKALYFAREIKQLSSDLVDGLEEAVAYTKGSTDKTPNWNPNTGPGESDV